MKLNDCDIYQLGNLYRRATSRAAGINKRLLRKEFASGATLHLVDQRERLKELAEAIVIRAETRANNPKPRRVRELLAMGVLSRGKARILRSFYRQTECPKRKPAVTA